VSKPHYIKNREKILEQNKIRYRINKQNPVWVEHNRLIHRQSDAKRKEKTHAYQKIYRAQNKEKIAAKMKAWRLKNIEKERERHKLLHVKLGTMWAKTQKERRQKDRITLFDTLGRKCIFCGYSDIRALQFDHINGGGRRESLRHGNGQLMIRYYSRHPEEAREKLQVLCANCNWIKK